MTTEEEEKNANNCERYKKIILWLLLSGALFSSLLVVLSLFWFVFRPASQRIYY